MIVITVDGKIYAGRNADDVLTRMREDGFLTFEKTNDQYMRFVAMKALEFEGVVVRFSDAQTFLEDMAINDILTITEEL